MVASPVSFTQSLRLYALLDVQNRLDFRVHPVLTSRELYQLTRSHPNLEWGWVFDTDRRIYTPMRIQEGKVIHQAPMFAREACLYPIFYNANLSESLQ